MRAKSVKQLLLEARYPGDIEADIRALRVIGWSWREVAETISRRADIEVTYESLRQWYGQPEPVGDAS